MNENFGFIEQYCIQKSQEIVESWFLPQQKKNFVSQQTWSFLFGFL